MGTCFSSSLFTQSQLLPPPPMANVVSINCTLRQYTVPSLASQVLHAEAAASSSSSSSTSHFFLCNSDMLSYEESIPALDSESQLYANQLYFVLPKSKLQGRLTASDMAALAVKASLALQNASKKDGRRRKKARISPVLSVAQPSIQAHDVMKTTFEKPNIYKGEQQPVDVDVVGFSKSKSVRKLQRYTSRRAKLAVRSFRLRLSTIHEGTVL